ncbi:hypothetical protein CKM354_000007600 [Cercospora kikuchii]|uniref:Uncharacterized protein n=1 Tax=Cercospora kikuchii TaxID=84275 RepID=A0A9P3C8D2_9PEZI|nr:uncharacterized protein CKM354_000007600 [Cercospora kikuchii]GIZ36606.1 hypothetical protein CKM354_000007600 [Cercospora kikuchii]
MKHESGIEVYLIPADNNPQRPMRFPELPHNQEVDAKSSVLYAGETQAEYRARQISCFVNQDTTQRYKIVVRFEPDYDFGTATAVLVGVGVGYHRAYEWWDSASRATKALHSDNEPKFDYYRKHVDAVIGGQQFILEGKDGNGYEVPEFDRHSDLEVDKFSPYPIRKDAFDDHDNPGTLTVVVQKGHVNWPAEAEISRRDQRSADHRSQYIISQLTICSRLEMQNALVEKPCDGSSFKRVHSKNGWKIRFEFRLRSWDLMHRVEESYLLTHLQRDPARYSRVRDHDFAAREEQAENVRLQLEAGSFVKAPKQKTRKCPAYRCINTCRKRTARIEPRIDGAEELDMPRAKKAKGCLDCSELNEHAMNYVIFSNSYADPLTASSAHNYCEGCKNLPEEEKWRYVQRDGRWMRVLIDDPVSNQSSQDGQEDGEETSQQDFSAKQILPAKGSTPQQPLLPLDQDDEEIVNMEEKLSAKETLSSGNGKSRTGKAKNQPVSFDSSENQDTAQAKSGILEGPVPASSRYATRDPGYLEPQGTVPDNDSASAFITEAPPTLPHSNTAAQTYHRSDSGGLMDLLSSPLRVSTTPPRPQPSRMIHGASEEPLYLQQTAHRGHFSLADSPTFANNTEQLPASRKPRTILDLMEDRAEENRGVKKERSEVVEVEYQYTQVAKQESEDEDEVELRNIRLRREEIKLERREAELERKLKLKQKAAAKPPVKVKVKQEIIEID